MGLNVELQDERGLALNSVPDTLNTIARLLPDDDSFPFLSSIDLYGDTVFNRPQMTRFLIEWQSLAAKARTDEERELLASIELLARRCQSEAHLYLKFIGD
jgi:hypothetical protein